MENSLMLPARKSGSGIIEKRSAQKEINSFSQIETNAGSELRGTRMHSLRYELDAKKIIRNL